METHDLAQDRAVALFSFLRELAELSTKTVRNLEDYESVMWLSEIPRSPDVRRMAWRSDVQDELSDVWLEIKKPEFKSPPKVPSAVSRWVLEDELQNSDLERPNLKQEIPAAATRAGAERGNQDGFEHLADHPEIQQIWSEYVEAYWKPWAKEKSLRKSVQEVYANLFSLYQKQEQLGEEYEILVGSGLLQWKINDRFTIKRHILVAQSNLAFDPAKATVSVGPPGEGANLKLEQDMLEIDQRPEILPPAFNVALGEIGDAIWDTSKMVPAITSWVNSLSPHAIYSEKTTCQDSATEIPTVTLAPALILRKRSERSIVTMLRDIGTNLQSVSSIPATIKRLVCEEDVPNHPGQPRRSEEIYFTKPANEEQIQLVERILEREGVVVQGPPGTGKSHTIANLISHFLATGKRVLITSHTPRALRVLRDKIPDSIAALCIMLLDNDRQALKDLEACVDRITRRYENWSSSENSQTVSQLEKELDELKARESVAENRLIAIRERESYRHPKCFSHYEGTASEIADQLNRKQSEFSWIGELPDEGSEPPITDDEASRLLQLLRIRKDRSEDLNKKTIAPTLLLEPDGFSHLVQMELQAERISQESQDHRNHSSYSVLKTAERDFLRLILESVNRLRCVIQQSFQHPDRWVHKATEDVLARHSRSWIPLLQGTKDHLNRIEDKAKRTSGLVISGVRGKNLVLVKEHAISLLDHFESGKRIGVCIFGLWLYRPPVVKQCWDVISEISVNDRPCTELETLRDFIEWLEVVIGLDSLRRLWSGIHIVRQSESTIAISHFHALHDTLKEILDLRRRIENLKSQLQDIPGLAEPSWHRDEDLEALVNAIEALAAEDRFNSIKDEIESRTAHILAAATAPASHPTLQGLAQAIRDRDEVNYGLAFGALQDLNRFYEEMEVCENLLNRLHKRSPNLSKELQDTCLDQEWNSRLTNFQDAWNWARCDAWLQKLLHPEEEERLNAELRSIRHDLQQCMERLVEEKAWGYCFQRMSNRELSHLIAWRAAMDRVGRGTGRHAARHRKDAHDHMKECRSAIPAWIMPIFRIAETMSVRPELFDVVIVDEASQSGPEAIFLYYLAKKIIIVGDDKQISPESFIDQDQVVRLRDQHIPDLRNKEAYGVEYSLFDIAKIFYPRFIRLKEHFRCMPEIIKFSNELCYSDQPLIPLRQHAGNRLPPVVAQHVSNGFQKGPRNRTVNPPEAKAIVQAIKECVEDPLYENKSIGVISLLGRSQAQYIEELLRDAIGPEEMARRRLVCGDPYAFQGDERDVVFLSLVRASTANNPVMALTLPRDERRFNVAVSRARDQVQLFHTVTVNDLRPHCLRNRLIEHFQNPSGSQISGPETKEIRDAASVVGRRDSRAPQPFDSWFEVDVYLRIKDSGFRSVRPQFEVAGYFIDLVVEGLESRLAVECDGDAFHGPEQYAKDMSRQRLLERCGWRFWRIRGSAFYRDPDGSLQGLWETLSSMNIRPDASGCETAATADETQASALDLAGDRDKQNSSTHEKSVRKTPSTEGTNDHNGVEGVANRLDDSQGQGDDTDLRDVAPVIPLAVDLSIPVLLLIEMRGGELGMEDTWDAVLEFLDCATKVPGEEFEWPLDFRERFLWALSWLSERGLLKELRYRTKGKRDEIAWKITDKGLRELKEQALI
ncbi:MAG: AAA domain-containing protein [Pseudomonadota bacterium]